MILALFRIVFIAFVLLLIFAVVRFFQSLGAPEKKNGNPHALQGTMVKDEFCQTYIPKEEAIKEVRDGKEYFFCSKGCRDKFFGTKSKVS